jgi:hypothetical protein
MSLPLGRYRFSFRSLLFLLLLIGGVLYQGYNLLPGIRQELLEVRGAIGQSGLWRSAYFFREEQFANFIKFIHLNTPENARIVLPPRNSSPAVLSTTPLMQFFLAPREVINCPDLACYTDLSLQNTYFLFVDPSQIASMGFGQQQLRMFNRDWGVILPENAQPGSYDSMPVFTSLAEITQIAFLPVLWLVILTSIGVLIIQRLAPGMTFLAKAGLGYGLSLGCFTLLVSMASMLGLALDRSLLIGITGILLLVSLAIFFLGRKPGEISLRAPLVTLRMFRLDIWPVVFILLGGAAALISLGKGYHTTDAMMLWGAKGYGIASDSTILSVTSWGTNTVPYPLHIPVLIANFRELTSAGGLSAEVLPASKLVFSGYYLGLILVAYSTLIQIGVKRLIAGLGVLLLATVPLIFRHATIGYANLPLSYYLVAAISLLAISFETRESLESEKLAFLSGLLFVLAAWTRPESLIFSWVCIGVVLCLVYLRKWEPFSWRKTLLLIAPLGIYGLFWWLVKNLVYASLEGRPNLTSEALAQAIKGNFHLNEILYIIQNLFIRLASLSDWGVMGFGLILLLGAALFFPKPQRRASTILLVSGLLYTVFITGMYYLTSFDNKHDLSWWVSTGLERMLFPAIILLWLGAISRIQLLNHRE